MNVLVTIAAILFAILEILPMIWAEVNALFGTG